MDYTEFKRQILKLTNVDLNAYKEAQMKRRIDAIVQRHQCKNYQQYIELIIKDKSQLEEFMSYLTINVSEFFRNPMQWKVLEEQMLPKLLQNKRSIKIWSAACSTGDEPYSLAMLLTRFLPLDRIQIIATDIDEEVLTKAKVGTYHEKYVLGVPKDLKSKYMIQDGDKFTVKDEIKRCVQFSRHNLLSDPYPKQVDLIICRNVVIYFTDDAKEAIYEKFSRALAPGGILFVGSTEQIITPSRYNLESHKIFFYHKK